MHFIHKRHYLLRDKNGRKIIQQTSFFSGFKILQDFDEEKLRQIVQDLTPLFLQKIKKSEAMSNFWQQATDKIKQDLILSYHYHEYLGKKKILNVETENWLSIDFFKQTHATLAKNRFFIFKPMQALLALRATFGKHNLNLRFENIHLAVDKIAGKYIYQVHWDKIYPSSLLKTLGHFLRDDIFG